MGIYTTDVVIRFFSIQIFNIIFLSPASVVQWADSRQVAELTFLFDETILTGLIYPSNLTGLAILIDVTILGYSNQLTDLIILVSLTGLTDLVNLSNLSTGLVYPKQPVERFVES